MSRIGKLPVTIPEKVEVKVDGPWVSVKGPGGELEQTFTNNVNIKVQENQVEVTPADKSLKARAMWGTARTIISNMVNGVTEGFKKTLEFNGVGYKAQVKGQNLELNLGYSHPIVYELPEGISAKVVKNTIEISGSSRELVGFVAAKIRSFRLPEPYKGKGVKYIDETIVKKAGKSGGK